MTAQTHDTSTGLRLPTLTWKVKGPSAAVDTTMPAKKSTFKGLSDSGENRGHIHDLHVRPLVLHRRSVLWTEAQFMSKIHRLPGVSLFMPASRNAANSNNEVVVI